MNCPTKARSDKERATWIGFSGGSEISGISSSRFTNFDASVVFFFGSEFNKFEKASTLAGEGVEDSMREISGRRAPPDLSGHSREDLAAPHERPQTAAGLKSQLDAGAVGSALHALIGWKNSLQRGSVYTTRKPSGGRRAEDSARSVGSTTLGQNLLPYSFFQVSLTSYI